MYYLFWSKASKFNIYNQNSKKIRFIVILHSETVRIQRWMKKTNFLWVRFIILRNWKRLSFIYLLLHNWDMIKNHCTWSASASYQRSLPQPALNSSQLHLDYIPPLLFSGQYLYTRSAFHLAKISGLSFRKISSSNGKAFSLPGIEPRFESYTWHFIG